MKKFALSFIIFSLYFILTSCAGQFYTPTIVTQHNYSSFDISFKWSYQNNVLNLTGLNDFWTEIFDVQLTIIPVNKKMKPVGKPFTKYIGALERNATFNIRCHFNAKNVNYLKIEYYYTYGGYNSSGSRLNFYTIYLKVK